MAYEYIEVPAVERDETLVAGLLTLWEDSVRASHHFLQDSDIEALKPFVVEGIKVIPVLYVAYAEGVPVAFMGIADRKIEMLFVSPAHFGNGIGKSMINIAIENHEATFVDVNEQNPQALAFYQRMGFVVFDRNGRPRQSIPYSQNEAKLLRHLSLTGK